MSKRRLRRFSRTSAALSAAKSVVFAACGDEEYQEAVGGLPLESDDRFVSAASRWRLVFALVLAAARLAALWHFTPLGELLTPARIAKKLEVVEHRSGRRSIFSRRSSLAGS